MIKKRKVGKIILFSSVVIISLSMTACRKKSKNISDYNEDEQGKGTELNSGNSDSDNERSVLTESWNENLRGGNDGFSSIKINTSISEYDPADLNIYSVKYKAFNPEYKKELCEDIFDEKTVDVYDYSNPTKSIYDEKISDLDALYKEPTYHETGFENFYPASPRGYGYDFELKEKVDAFDKNEILKRIEKFESKKEKAPEKLDNNFTYDGYSGLIDGEEYYIYFGNRNYDEYLNSPISVQKNNRVITLMKKDIQRLNNTEKNIDTPDDSLEANFDAVISYEYKNTDLNVSDECINTADEFVKKIGFGDYQLKKETYRLKWGNKLNLSYVYSQGFKFCPSTSYEIEGGYALRYSLFSDNSDEFNDYDVPLDNYAEDKDVFDRNSDIYVFVNDDNKILGCQIYNPAQIIKTENVKSLISAKDLQEITENSVNNKNSWNITSYNLSSFDIDSVKLTYFPFESDTNDDEYKLIPCYIIYKKTGEYNPNVTLDKDLYVVNEVSVTPCLVINGIDGSIVNIKDTLDDYPKGANNGNIGYGNLIDYKWERFKEYEEK